MKATKLSLQKIDGFIFDLDGTVYLGENALPGAVEVIGELRRLGKRTLFVTNKPLEPRSNYAAKLTRLGIPTCAEEIITSGFVLSFHLAKSAPNLAYYVIGEENLKDELRQRGLKVVGEFAEQDEKEVIDPSGVEAVIVAFDRTLDYRKLNTAYQALMRGSRFLATNPDKTCPMPGGGIPDAGGTLAALEHMTGRKVELVAGKPSELMLQVAMETLNLPPERCLMVGDRLETDVRMAKEAGMMAVLVLSGATRSEQVVHADPAADLVLENLGALREWLA